MTIVALAAALAAQAPATSAPEVQPIPAVSADSTPAVLACCRLAALSPVELVVVEEVSSKTAWSGQAIRLALAKPLYVTNSLGLPAGTPVEGIVLHAAHKGMGGKPGELLLAARRIALPGGGEVRLRSFKLAPARGKNNEVLANATTAAVGLVGLLITGGSATAPAGATASAKTAEEAVIPLAQLTSLPPLQAETPIPAPAPSQTQTTATQGEM